MPFELLVAVLVVLALVNLALLVARPPASSSRSWPDTLGGAIDAVQRRGAGSAGQVRAGRRRPLYVAGRPAGQPSDAAGPPLEALLPPELAAIVKRPAVLYERDDESVPERSGEPAAGAEDRRGAASLDTPGRGRPSPADLAAPAPTIVSRPVPSGQPWSRSERDGGPARDPATGLDGKAAWVRLIQVENARLIRYRRPVTVVVLEVDGIGRLAEELGGEPAERVLSIVANALRGEARAADWVARIGDARFGVLLAETDEIQAANYVERVRLVCAPWLAAAMSLRLAIGWASPPVSGDLDIAIRAAEERMNGDRRQASRTTLLTGSVPPPVWLPPPRLRSVDAGQSNGARREPEHGPTDGSDRGPGGQDEAEDRASGPKNRRRTGRPLPPL